jgi:ribosomal protein S18 acetylase RimI-like enzyme
MDPPEDVWVAFDEDRMVGFAAGCNKWDEPFKGEWFITAVYVDPEVQGRGTGRLVLRAAVGHGLNLGQEDVKLSVFQENHPARGFYAKCGGEETVEGTWEWEGESYPIVFVRFSQTP